MPIPFAIPIGLFLGAAFAWAVSDELIQTERRLTATAPFALVLFFSAFVFAPVLGYFLIFHGDWSYLYSVPWVRVPSAIDMLVWVVSSATVPLGFAASITLLRRRLGRSLGALLATLFAVTVVLLLATSQRLGVNATYAQYHGGFGGESIGASALGRSVLVMLVIVALATLWTLHQLRRRALR